MSQAFEKSSTNEKNRELMALGFYSVQCLRLASKVAFASAHEVVICLSGVVLVLRTEVIGEICVCGPAQVHFAVVGVHVLENGAE